MKLVVKFNIYKSELTWHELWFWQAIWQFRDVETATWDPILSLETSKVLGKKQPSVKKF
jgi:hypothetical protein